MTVDDLTERITLLQSVETVDAQANRIHTYTDVADVWASVTIKPRYVTRDNSTEQIVTYHIVIRKTPVTFDAVRVGGRIMPLKIPAYSDKVYTYIEGEV